MREIWRVWILTEGGPVMSGLSKSRDREINNMKQPKKRNVEISSLGEHAQQHTAEANLSAGGALALISRPALLLTESAVEFDKLQAMLVQEIDPHGIIEEMHVAETAKIVWEMLRIQR